MDGLLCWAGFWRDGRRAGCRAFGGVIADGGVGAKVGCLEVGWVVENFGCRQRCLTGVEIGEANLGVGVDHRLMVNVLDALWRAHVERI
jgi:hypothetical protein